MKTDNEIIAEFMGEINPFQIRGYFAYDRSWDWLMPVVQRIYKMYNEFEFTSIEQENMFLNVLDMPIKFPISMAYMDVVKFIKWYQENKVLTT